MTISTTQSKVTLLGNGATTVFSFPFVADSASDISVVYVNTSGATVTLPPSTYTLFINPKALGAVWGVGGTVTYPLSGSPIPNGSSITIERTLPLQQLVSISNQGDFYPQVTEQALDELEMQIQQVSTDQEYNLQFPLTDVIPPNSLPSAQVRANGFLGFDGSGQPIVISAIPTTSIIGPFTKLVFVSAYPSLVAADTAATAIGGALIIDGNVSLSGNTVLQSKVVYGLGGIISCNGVSLTINNVLDGADLQIIDATVLGSSVNIIGESSLRGVWFNGLHGNSTQTCTNTYAELRALFPTGVTIPAGFVVQLNGGSALGDSGVGEFYYNSTDVSTSDDGGVFIVDGAGRRWYRSFIGPVFADWYILTQSAASNNNAQFSKAIAASLKLYNRIDVTFGLGTFYLDPATASGGVAFDGVAGGYAVTNGTLCPGIKYTVGQTSGGGTIGYAGTSYTTGQTFVGRWGYPGFTASNANVYLSGQAAVIVDTAGTVNPTIRGSDRYGSIIRLKTAAVNGYVDVAFLFRNGTTASGGRSTVLERGQMSDLRILGVGAFNATPQIGVVMAGTGNGSVFDIATANLTQGMLFIQSFNVNLPNVHGTSNYHTICATTAVEFTTGNCIIQAAAGALEQPTCFLLFDSAATNFVSAGVVAGDTVDVSDLINATTFHCTVREVGWQTWNGSSWVQSTNSIVAQITGGFTQSVHLAGGNHFKFTSGTQSGNEFTMDINSTTTASSALRTTDYVVSRTIGGIGFCFWGPENCPFNGGQFAHIGEAGILFLGSSATTGGGTCAGKISWESEGPMSAISAIPQPYDTVGFTGSPPAVGIRGIDATGTGINCTQAPPTGVGRVSMIYLSGVADSVFVGSGANKSVGSLISISSNCYGIEHAKLRAYATDSVSFDCIDRQAGSVGRAIDVQVLGAPDITPAGFTGYSANVAAVTASAVRSVVTSSNAIFGNTKAFPFSVQLDIQTTLTAISATAGARVQFTLTPLDNAGNPVTASAVVITSLTAAAYASDTGIVAHQYAEVGCNFQGQFQIAAAVSGTGWTLTTAIKQVRMKVMG